MMKWSSFGAALVVLCLTSCDGRKAVDVECRSAAIVGGTEFGEYVALARPQYGAIVRLVLSEDTLAGRALCTAVLVAPGAALTAKHCIVAEVTALHLLFNAGSDAGQPVDVVPAGVEMHPTLDLALLTWSPGIEIGNAIRPIPVDLDDVSDIGALVQIAGYGRNENAEYGVLRFATTQILENTEETFRVFADRRAGACDGDSGGPALNRGNDGSVRVVGILSSGATGCADTDLYTSLRGIGTWLATQGVVEGAPDELADCVFVGREGRCFANSVLHCPDGVSARVELCKPETHCGFDAATSAFHCLAPGRDPCKGIGDLGACDGEDLLRCEEGLVVRAPCAVCGAECKHSVRDGRAICTR